MKTNVYFISGIDTGCGKTYVTGYIAKHQKEKGVNVITQKLIQTGCKGTSEDISEHRRIMNTGLFPEDKTGLTCPYVLSFPASPHLASKIDNIDVDIKIINKSTEKLSCKYELVLCEGAGGLMAPVTENYLTIDFVKDNKLPLILVASSKLGSINHTLLSLEVCKSCEIDLRYVIYNQFPDDDKLIAEDSYNYLKKYIKEKFLNTKFINLKEIKSIDL